MENRLSKVRDISRKWGVEKDVPPIVTTLNHYWQAGIPFMDETKPIDFHTLVLGKQDREKEYYAKLPTGYFERLLKIRELPDTTSRVRYLFHLFFPTPENLRWRYNLSSKWSIIPYYFVHILYTCKKFFTGLWYQILYDVSRNSIT